MLAMNLDYNKYNSGIKAVPFAKSCAYSAGVAKGDCSEGVPQISPRKNRLAARFDKAPSASGVSVETNNVSPSLKV